MAVTTELDSTHRVTKKGAHLQYGRRHDRAESVAYARIELAEGKSEEKPSRQRPSARHVFAQTLAWLALVAKNGASKVTPEALRRTYRRSLVVGHTLLFDRRCEKLLFRPTYPDWTIPPIPDAEDIPPALRTHMVYDGPVPRKVFGLLMSVLPADLREHAFVDFHAGRGRTLLYSAMYPFERVIGFEFDHAAHDDAQMNIAQFPRSLMRCRDVECRLADREGIEIPDQPAVLFFPHAFREQFMELIISHVSASYRLGPRRIYMIFENPPDEIPVARSDIFEELKIPLTVRLKLGLFSPANYKIYRSLV